MTRQGFSHLHTAHIDRTRNILSNIRQAHSKSVRLKRASAFALTSTIALRPQRLSRAHSVASSRPFGQHHDQPADRRRCRGPSPAVASEREGATFLQVCLLFTLLTFSVSLSHCICSIEPTFCLACMPMILYTSIFWSRAQLWKRMAMVWKGWSIRSKAGSIGIGEATKSNIYKQVCQGRCRARKPDLHHRHEAFLFQAQVLCLINTRMPQLSSTFIHWSPWDLSLSTSNPLQHLHDCWLIKRGLRRLVQVA